MDKDRLARAVPAGADVALASRYALERALDLGVWLDIYQRVLKW